MRGTLALAGLVLSATALPLGVAGSAVAAGSASPQSIAVDCGAVSGVTPTTITGLVGDTFTVDNTAGTDSCTFASYDGVVTATGLDVSDKLSAGALGTLTIVAAGTFSITPGATGGVTATMTIAIGQPATTPEYTISFDPNGGICGPDAQTLTAASGDWYALPTDGTGAGQCHRDDYLLAGWNLGTTPLKPGSEEQAPDVPLPTPGIPPAPRIPGSAVTMPSAQPTPAPTGSSQAFAQIADHATLVAQWTPLGVEITYDANVDTGDPCLDPSGTDLTMDLRSSRREVFYAGTQDTLAVSAPCTPNDPDGNPLPLTGWALTGDGPVAYAPGTDVTMTKLNPGTSPTLYAVWGFSSPAEPTIGDDNLQIGYAVDSTTLELVLTMQVRGVTRGWAGLSFHSFMFPADTLLVSFDPTRGMTYFDGYNPGIPTLTFFPAPVPDDAPVLILEPPNPNNNQENWTGVESQVVDGVTTVELRRKLVTGDIFDIALATGRQYPVCWAYNLSESFDTQDFYAQQPSHQAFGCDVLALT